MDKKDASTTLMGRRAVLGRSAGLAAGALLLGSSRLSFGAGDSPATASAVPKELAAALTRMRLRMGTFVCTPRAFIGIVGRSMADAAQMVRGGIRVEAEPVAIDWLQSQGLVSYLPDDGEVTTSSALTGLEEALIFIAVVGTLSGLAVGYLRGYEDGLEAAAEDEGEGGEGDGGGGDDDAGDGEGGEGGDGEDGEDGE
jgi:hypothetical protein